MGVYVLLCRIISEGVEAPKRGWLEIRAAGMIATMKLQS
jgi:hypothetical protein